MEYFDTHILICYTHTHMLLTEAANSEDTSDTGDTVVCGASNACVGVHICQCLCVTMYTYVVMLFMCEACLLCVYMDIHIHTYANTSHEVQELACLLVQVNMCVCISVRVYVHVNLEERTRNVQGLACLGINKCVVESLLLDLALLDALCTHRR